MWAAFCARDSSTGVGICKCSQVEHEIPSASGPRLLEVGVGEEALRGRHRHAEKMRTEGRSAGTLEKKCRRQTESDMVENKLWHS